MSTIPQTSAPSASSDASTTAEPLLIQHEREALREILRLVTERAAGEASIEPNRDRAFAQAEEEYQKARQTLIERVEAVKEAARKQDEDRRKEIVKRAMEGEQAAKEEFARASRRIASEFDTVREASRREYQRARAEAAATFETGEREAAAQHAAASRPINEAAKVIEAFRDRLDAFFLEHRNLGLPEASATANVELKKGETPHDAVFDRLARAQGPLDLLEGLFIPKLVKWPRYVWVFVVLFFLLLYPLGSFAGWGMGAGIAAVLAAVAGLGLRLWFLQLARSQISRMYFPLVQTLVDVEAITLQWRAGVNDLLKSERARVVHRRDTEYQQATQNQTNTVKNGEAARDDQLRRINEIYAQRNVEIQTKQQMEMRDAIEAYERKKVELAPLLQTNEQKLNEKHKAHMEKIQGRYESAWSEMATRWREGMKRAQGLLDEVGRVVDGIGPAWNDPSWDDRPLPVVVPTALPFGDATLELARLPHGVPASGRLREETAMRFRFPALLPFPDRANVIVETPPEGRAEALRLLQATMLRLLTSLPPGQVRFTIVDPVGIGRNFGAFMHLADFDEALVTNQIWTDPRQIEERLGDLAAHMERVTQRYLRNEYATIGEYNAVAGEVAEPYRVLVIADFPAGFDEKSAARLAGIATGGIPCGVLTLVAVDPQKPLPGGITLDDLRQNAVRLAWEDGRLNWDDPDFGSLPLALDAPPGAEAATRLIHRAGAAARDAKRVEVPFEFIAPAQDAWWAQDSRSGIDVALGKVGATKRQHLTLGHGTSQHVLVAGRTGSGKSTLLHALIVNLALNYSPDEVDLYLIDFKKGVEFKVYATYNLPHASVVAIESEREFGISVLQRLDAEMRQRAERFREVGVQDLNGYRNAAGTPPLPRVCLIIDEFQEFFVEEDKVAQEAALLLDRLVRQGRAFGVHVHLGSQTLGGAYALARSTLGQMAVRIALQCSEADAHLILSEQNPAAKMLTRPGEAVYNDANGLPEANHFFQVVWLSDERREAYLKQLQELARERRPTLARTPIVFEGDAPAELSRNPLLAQALEPPAWPGSPRSAQAWLGDAVAIKDPTSALFRRQGGNHLLVVGQNGESALAITAAALLGLAAQYPLAESDTIRSGARFVVLDGTPEDHPHAGYLARIANVFPHSVEIGGYRDVPAILAAVGAEIERRQQPDAPDGPEIFVFIHDMPRFRELRKREDDFGFGRRDEPAGPADHLRTLLREGSVLGVHLITWCDNLNNINRLFDNQMLREFEMRVLFQMSPTDSAHLLDSPAASRLGPNRAYFSSEEENRLEKFRPYGFPSDEWLGRVSDRFRERLG